MRARVLATAALGLALVAPASGWLSGSRSPSVTVAAASDDGGPGVAPPARPATLADLWELLDLALADARASAPLPPPVPVKVAWKARRVASLDLGAPLLALAAGDLDGDGRAELVALTERAVVVMAPARRGMEERARIGLPSEPASIRPRDAVGALAVAGGEIWARSSAVGRGARYRLDGGALREVAPVAGFAFCAGREVDLVPGRNLATDAGGAFLARRCRDDLIDERGRRLAAEATVDAGGRLALTVVTRCPAGSAGCPADRTVSLDGAGVAFELDDVDRDGRLEVITSGAGAPGDADAVTVRRLGPAGLVGKPLYRRSFSGGIAALGSGDVDGDGDRDVFAAVRLAGARKVDLWLLD